MITPEDDYMRIQMMNFLYYANRLATPMIIKSIIDFIKRPEGVDREGFTYVGLLILTNILSIVFKLKA